MTNPWAPKPVLEQREEPTVSRLRGWRFALYVLFHWVGMFVGFLAFEAVTPISVRAGTHALYASEWSLAWVPFACLLVMGFVGVTFATAYEGFLGRREA